jgi:hypothetical protein
MKSISLPYAHAEEQQPSEFKKVVLGLVYTFLVEIIFFLGAALSVAILWYLVFHCVDLNDHQQVYVYHPYEVKYLFITVGGMKRRVAVKKFWNRKILGQ